MLELVETMMLSPELSIELGLAILALLFSRMRGENAAQTIVQESPQSERLINLQGRRWQFGVILDWITAV